MVRSQRDEYQISSYQNLEVYSGPANVIPMVVEQSGMGERAFDL
ncbi:MAG: ATP-dependent Clp protease proteolytic subunit, partial [Okeania sp. SIO2H7]|nr:ATP-dependent Clp protease proteolytic subunit [Okeania sp. SIO2H7]